MILGMYQQQRAVLLRPGEKQRAGQTYSDWDNPLPEQPLVGLRIEQGDAREEMQREDSALADFTAWLPLESGVRHWHRLRFDYAGRTVECELDGDPVTYLDPLGLLSHAVASLIERKDART